MIVFGRWEKRWRIDSLGLSCIVDFYPHLPLPSVGVSSLFAHHVGDQGLWWSPSTGVFFFLNFFLIFLVLFFVCFLFCDTTDR